jgi:hypothetical protein
VTFTKSAKLKFCPGVCRNRPTPGVFITEEGRCECCDGGVDGGSWDEAGWLRGPGDLDGELARYSNRSAPSCFAFELLECLVGGGVRGGEDEMILLDDGW